MVICFVGVQMKKKTLCLFVIVQLLVIMSYSSQNNNVAGNILPIVIDDSDVITPVDLDNLRIKNASILFDILQFIIGILEITIIHLNKIQIIPIQNLVNIQLG